MPDKSTTSPRNLFIQETYINRTENYRFGESDVYESGYADKGRLFKRLQSEYGRCESRVYIDTDTGTKPIGWVFVGKSKYDDSDDTYLREVWVTLHEAPPTKTIEYHYAGN
jgi:hypothetical protein